MHIHAEIDVMKTLYFFKISLHLRCQ